MTSASLSVLDPTLIDGIRDRLADDFARRIFDAIPDISDCVEFEAEACEPGKEKQGFERASQLLYARRRDLEVQIAAAIRRIFDEKLYRLLDGASRTARLSLDNITLLADERLDEEIAINHCGRRLKEQCEYELWGLTRRIATVTGIKHPADSQNPVFTQTFAQALMEAVGSFETNAGVRLVVFKTFGPALLDIVSAVYKAANAALEARGIEIESGEYYGRPVLTAERPTGPSPTQQEIALGAARANLELTTTLEQILARSGTSLSIYVEPKVSPQSAPTQDERLATTLQLPAVRLDEAAESDRKVDLSDLETNDDGESANTAGPRTLHGARRALHEKLTRDEQVISDIVTVMFDRLLADPRLPPPLRPSVARLQFPILELALRDRSLLTQVHHPVRKLLDLIAEFGLTLGLAGADDDSTVRSVENIIDGLVQIRNDEPHAFKLAFDQLDNLFYHHEEATLQSDKGLRLMERKEAAEFARTEADREIAVRLQNLTLPAAIIDFVVTTWRDVLVHDFLYGGPQGRPWKLGLLTLDDIIKSLRPSTDETARRRLVNTLPSFIEILLIAPNAPDGLGATDAPEAADKLQTGKDKDIVVANFFEELHRAHELALAGKWAEIGGTRFVPSAAALVSSHSLASPSALIASMGLACGDWIETRDTNGTRRWRLNWITSIFGTCVFKHYETNTMRNMSSEELRTRLLSAEVHRVRGLGLTDELINGAFETVSRKARRDEAMLAKSLPSATNRMASATGVSHRWAPSATASPPPAQGPAKSSSIL